MTLRYAVCTIKPWNIAAFHRHVSHLPGTWRLFDTPQSLSADAVNEFAPRYIFFPHWSWRVKPEILHTTECVCFHMSDVPYGRGGSPLQNLIQRGHTSTMMTALRMVEELDAGPVYLKRQLTLDGRAEEIFVRAADLIYTMIEEIVTTEPIPKSQEGEPMTFLRRTRGQSLLPKEGDLDRICDFIRMLDAPTYPKAFINWGRFKLEFDYAKVNQEGIEARVIIRTRTS